MEKNNVKSLTFDEYTALSYILVAMFYAGLGDWEKRKAQEILGTYNPRWLQMIANANMDHPEAAADEAAREFCVEWLEAHGFKVTLEADNDHDSD